MVYNSRLENVRARNAETLRQVDSPAIAARLPEPSVRVTKGKTNEARVGTPLLDAISVRQRSYLATLGVARETVAGIKVLSSPNSALGVVSSAL